jgi:hypothetical protein
MVNFDNDVTNMSTTTGLNKYHIFSWKHVFWGEEHDGAIRTLLKRLKTKLLVKI